MLGGNIFGHFADKKQTSTLLAKAKNLGITAIDTADVYSNGLSEEFIGENIKTNREQWFVATKVGLQSHASPEGLGRKNNIIQRVENSLKRLKSDYIDLYQIHHFDPLTPLEETLEAFELLVKQGKILAAGISNYNLNHLKLLKEGDSKCIKFHQMPLNITNFSQTKQVLFESTKQNISILAYSSLVRGLFNEKYISGDIPSGSRASISKNVQADLTPDFLCRLEKTAKLCKNHQVSLLDAAIQWVAQQQDVRWIIVGIREVDQLTSVNHAAANTLPKTLLNELEAIWLGFRPFKK